MKCSIFQRKKLTGNAIEIHLKPEEDFEFKAGQYIKVTLPKLKKDPLGKVRCFSIASSPNQKELVIAIRTHVNMHPFKRFLAEAPIDSKVVAEGPYGSFILPQKVGHKIVFIAGGIGISPFLSMILWATEKNRNQNIKLLHFNNTAHEQVYGKELRELSLKNKQFTFYEFYGKPEFDTLKKAIEDDKKSLYYIAGPPGMVSLSVDFLKKAGVPLLQIKTEKFKDLC